MRRHREVGRGQRRGQRHAEVLGVLVTVRLVPVPVVGEVEVGGGQRGRQGELVLVVHREVVVQLRQVAAARRRGRGAGRQLRGRHLHPRLGEQLGGEVGVEGRGHGDHGQVLGGDAAVLARHVRVEAVAGLGHGAAEDAPVAGADGVLVLHVRAQRVRGAIDLAALGAGPRVRGAHAHHLELAADVDGVHVAQHAAH